MKSNLCQGNITFDLEDKNILKLQEDDLKAMLETLGNQNKIVSVGCICLRKVITSKEDLKEFSSMRLSIGSSTP